MLQLFILIPYYSEMNMRYFLFIQGGIKIVNYITVKEFMEQPKEVQEVFLKWWEPEIGDLYCDIYAYRAEHIGCILNVYKREVIESDKKHSYYIPLLTEGQLRDFIYDTKALSLNIRCWYDGWIVETGCGIEEYDYNEAMREKSIREDLLDAYWLYVCEVAKESVENDSI